MSKNVKSLYNISINKCCSLF